MAIKYRLDFANGTRIGNLTGVSGLQAETEVEETAADCGIVMETPAALKWQDMKIKRPINANKALATWARQAMMEGCENARRNGTISQLDDNGAVIAEWAFENAWPSKHHCGGDGTGLREEMDIVYENLKRIR